MSKVRTFSTSFPANHPDAGTKTLFVEKILNSLAVDYKSLDYLGKLLILNKKNIDAGKLEKRDIARFWENLTQTRLVKFHTIRAGNHFKVGDTFSPRVWSGKPYKSAQIIFWSDLTVEYCPKFEQLNDGEWFVNDDRLLMPDRFRLALADGLLYNQMMDWFNKPFTGQIICWADVPRY